MPKKPEEKVETETETEKGLSDKNIKLPVLENIKFPEVPELQECDNCNSSFKVADLVMHGYIVTCCPKPSFSIRYAKREIFVEQDQEQISIEMQQAQNMLAMRYEDRGYDSSVESGKGKNAYKVYYNPDELERSKRRVAVGAFLKQFQENIDNLDLIKLFLAKGFSVENILGQIEVELKELKP